MARKIIRAQPPSLVGYLGQLWQYRQLIVVLARRDIKGHFAQTLLGWLWLLLRPLITLVLFTVFFDALLNLPTGTVPYPAFAFSGMLIWYFFSALVQASGTATLQATDLIQKVHFPRLILPLSKVAGKLFEFLLHLALLFGLLLVLGQPLDWRWLLAPLFLIPALIAALALGLWLHVLSVRFRDLHHLIPHLTNFAVWLTPVFYPSTIIPPAYRDWLYYLNPVASAIEGLRWCFFGTSVPWEALWMGTAWTLLLLLAGAVLFIRQERTLADRL